MALTFRIRKRFGSVCNAPQTEDTDNSVARVRLAPEQVIGHAQAVLEPSLEQIASTCTRPFHKCRNDKVDGGKRKPETLIDIIVRKGPLVESE